ncbi:DUF2945 domain-containing protein [Gloeobacter kilaueensis]|uniref:Hypervirulence associated protein TUDOR domain-containing protein n=1 Tax=Gloeobacter kilaueensis (strain ATCC BAA-2537 / CCAP 1431/1 / ULC 316 / JS1) TaxID=1183438 RepID=U5QP19_GLOK1|nr:DUF2945 domain-containing protein [Gloeobacter kilaueensis]AGY59390.1 hypothetical protein GKIL_3144 [Gloeobacter kilaueensis JS1]
MSDTLKVGDRVEWHSSGGTSIGKIKQKLTSPTHIKDHKVNASEEEPQYLVVSDKTGEEAAHKPEALKKLKGDKK